MVFYSAFLIIAENSLWYPLLGEFTSEKQTQGCKVLPHTQNTKIGMQPFFSVWSEIKEWLLYRKQGKTIEEQGQFQNK